MTYFHEEQRFRESWLWLVIAIPITFAVWRIVVTPGASASAAIAIVLVGIGAGLLLALARLETTVTADRVVVRFHGLWPTRTIGLDDIAAVAPMRYTMWDSGGWGVHFGLAGMTYNVSGNDGVHFVLRDGRRILVGTQRPAELEAAVATARAARPTG
ncbi:MAG TPA: hypothetical protein VGT60_04885 [Candidatus Limnocylindria bacterium]|nr:hypothetical protein [Candidatus Limnocylindria bacterium]